MRASSRLHLSCLTLLIALWSPSLGVAREGASAVCPFEDEYDSVTCNPSTLGAGMDDANAPSLECSPGDAECDAFIADRPPGGPDPDAPSSADGKKGWLDPVIGDGEFFTTVTDLSYPGFGLGFELKRSYRSRTSFAGPLGYSWDHGYDRRL